MSIRTLVASVTLCVLLIASPRLQGQLAAPGESGVVMGHIHLAVRDVAAHRQFWATLGGTPVKNGDLEMIQFPGVYVLVRQAEPLGGTVGSVVNHFGFHVRNLQESLTKWQAAGVQVEPGASARMAYLSGPEGVRVEIIEEPTIPTAIRMHHVHYFVTAPLEIQAWYAKMFGAVPGKRGNFDAGDLPGVNLTFSRAEAPLAPTRGRALDHIGFDVRNLEQLIKKLEVAGVKLDRPFQRIPNSRLAIAFLTDPWGTYIELTENLAPASSN